jgi:hypothetical protein
METKTISKGDMNMSVSGAFTIRMKTPVGVQEGTMTLVVKGNDLSGTLVNPRGSSDFSGGTVTGPNFEFSAKIQTPLGRIKAQVTGTVEGDTLRATAKIPLGSVQIDGTRIPESKEA